MIKTNFGPMNQFLSDMDSWLRVMSDPKCESDSFSPRTNIQNNETEYVLTMELPGVKKEDVNISLDDGELKVTGEKKHQQRDGENNFHISERVFGGFHRSFRLRGDVDEKSIRADFADGILHIILPKKGDAQKKTIQIN